MWHSHPGASTQPSRSDKLAWLSFLARSMQQDGIGVNVAIICADPEETSWCNPHVEGWVIDRVPTATLA